MNLSRRDRIHLALKSKKKASEHQSLMSLVSAYENYDSTMRKLIREQNENQLTEAVLVEEIRNLKIPSESIISEYTAHAKASKTLDGRIRCGISSDISSGSKNGNESIITNLRNYASSTKNQHETQLNNRIHEKNVENEKSKNSMKSNTLSEINQLLKNSGLDVYDESTFQFKPEMESSCFESTRQSESIRRDKIDESRKQFNGSIHDMIDQIKNKAQFPNTKLKF